MNPKVNYTLVGLFVVLFGAATIAWMFWLGVSTDEKNYKRYVAYMYQSVSGLNVNAAVKYRGVQVGRVSEIEIDLINPERVKLLLDIIDGTPIKNDSIAVLSTLGVTGLAYVELSGGSKEAPLLQGHDGQLPEIITGPSLFVRLDTALTDLFVEFKNIASEISGMSAAVKTVLNQNNMQAINTTLANMAKLTETLNTQLGKLDSHIVYSKEILANTATMSKEFPNMVTNVSSSMSEIRNIVSTIGKTAETLDKAVAGTQQEVSRSATDTLVQMSQLFNELHRTTQALNRILQDTERNPNQFIFGKKLDRAGPGE